MKFIVSTTTLLKALQVVAGVIGKATVLPILEDFILELKAGVLRISATDLQITITTEIRVESKDTGAIAMPARLLLDTLKTLPEQPLVFKIDDKACNIEIASETGRYKLLGEPADDFPKIPAPDKVTELTMPASVLGNALTKTMVAISSDELRPAMTGMLMQLEPERAVFVATDSHILVRLIRIDLHPGIAEKFIVPAKASAQLKRTLPDGDEPVKIAYNKSNVFFEYGSTKLVARLIDENYPDYDAVIPKESPNKLTVNRLELHNAIKRIALYSNSQTMQLVLSIAGSEIKISATDLDSGKEATERLTCSYEGNDMEIGFNARYLAQVVEVLDSAEVTIELSTPNRAGIVTPGENNDGETIEILIMPMAISA